MRKLMKRCLSLACAVLLLCSAAATAAAADVTAKPTTQKLYMMKEDGTTTAQVVKDFPIYNINYNNYMKIRDVGYLLDFQVEYNSEWKAVSIITTQHSDGVQVSTDKAVSQQTAKPAWSKLYIDGKEVSGLTMYNIAGNNYIKIRDIANAVGFGCCYSGELKAIVLSPFYGYSSNDVMTEGGRRTVAYGDGQGNLTFDRSGLFTAAAAPSTGTTTASTGTVYKAGDTVAPVKGMTYNVEIAVGEKCYMDATKIGDDWIEHYANWWNENGKAIIENPWDDTVKMSAITGLAPGTMTIECLSTADYKTVFAYINVTVTSGSGSGTSSGNDTSSGGITEQDAYNAIIALKSEYPNGMTWTNDNTYKGYAGCAAFGAICAETAFGTTKGTIVNGYDGARVGDRIRFNGHTVVVLEDQGDHYVVADGNDAGTIQWGWNLPKDYIAQYSGVYIETNWQ